MDTQNEQSSEAWSVLLSIVLLATGMAVGYLYGTRGSPAPMPPVSSVSSGELAVCESNLQTARRTAQTREILIASQKAALDEIERERQTYFTLLYEPGHGEQLFIGGVALLLGLPSGLGEIAKGLSPPETAWILPGKQTPLHGRATAQYAWWDGAAQQKSGPFKPQPFPQVAQR